MAALSTVIQKALRAGVLLAIVISLYQSAILIMGLVRGRTRREAANPLPRFALLICARNESGSVKGIVSDFQSQRYPRECFDIVVVAHNCSDDTVAVAREAGARVVEANDGRPGKAHAVAAGMRALPGTVDYVGVFDADSRVDENFLAAVAASIEGAECLQVEVVPERSDEWLSEGYGLGRRARNVMWWRPREALGLGVTISGTGWFIRPALHAELGPRLKTLTEDLELSTLMYSEGYTVRYSSDAAVTIQEPRTLGSSLNQRTRWARGHLRVIRRYWPKLLRRAASGDVRAMDMAIYLVAPTRVLTRSGITLGLVIALARSAHAVSWPLLGLGLLSEFVLPGAVGLKEKLVPATPAGATLAARHTLLSLLWFPIGFWGLLTARRESWSAMPRTGKD